MSGEAGLKLIRLSLPLGFWCLAIFCDILSWTKIQEMLRQF
jgi:hypothetical protein